MARKQRIHTRRTGPQPGEDDFIPLTDAERRAHADALTHTHEGHNCDEHASSLCRAAEYYAMLGETKQAEQLYREALATGTAEPGTVHAAYASFLLDQHRHPEALDMIQQTRRLSPDDPDVYTLIGEALHANGYHQQAARWFTAGIVRHGGSLTDLHINDLRYDLDLDMLARGRRQARQALGLTPDHIDELASQRLPATADETATTH